MSKIEFVSCDIFPEDEYTKEIVYLQINVPARVAFVRKASKNGGLFWSVASMGAIRNGQKEFFPAYIQDSNFLEKDIKEFLEKRKWESGARMDASVFEKPKSMSDAAIACCYPILK